MRVVLIRHAHSEANAAGVLSGRRPGIHLSEKGIKQAQDLAQRLGQFPVTQIRVSPMERCLETISPWIKTLEVSDKNKAITDHDLTEVDYGSWSGKKLSTLSRNKMWTTVQESPSRMYFPNGEGIAAMQIRAMRSIHSNIEGKKSGVSIFVSHGDVIKAVVASALGMHLDDFQRIIIDPASVTILDFSQLKPRTLLLNDTRAVVTDLLVAPARKKNLLGGGGGK